MKLDIRRSSSAGGNMKLDIRGQDHGGNMKLISLDKDQLEET
jgi:hypothetical protein